VVDEHDMETRSRYFGPSDRCPGGGSRTKSGHRFIVIRTHGLHRMTAYSTCLCRVLLTGFPAAQQLFADHCSRTRCGRHELKGAYRQQGPPLLPYEYSSVLKVHSHTVIRLIKCRRPFVLVNVPPAPLVPNNVLSSCCPKTRVRT